MNINEMFTVALGGENLFDEYPDNEQDGTLRFLGVEDALTSPYGFNGGFYYLRLTMASSGFSTARSKMGRSTGPFFCAMRPMETCVVGP